MKPFHQNIVKMVFYYELEKINDFDLNEIHHFLGLSHSLLLSINYLISNTLVKHHPKSYALINLRSSAF